MADEHDRTDDRSAILARRQQFIALALTGLASTACTNGKGKADAGKKDGQEHNDPEPQPCLSSIPDPPEPPPQPCLEPMPPEDPPPQPCLEIAPPEDPPPQPCLKVAPPEEPEGIPPHACLKIAPPEDPEPTPEPTPVPTPCLRKAAPDPD